MSRALKLSFCSRFLLVDAEMFVDISSVTNQPVLNTCIFSRVGRDSDSPHIYVFVHATE